MKKIFVSFLLLTNSFMLLAQYGTLELIKPEVVKSTETIVVVDYELPENKGLEAPLEAAMEKAWKISPYKVMARKALLSNIKRYYKSSGYSFIFIQYEKINKYGFQPRNRNLLLTLAINNQGDPGAAPPVTALAKSELNYDICNPEAELVKDLWLLQDQVTNGAYRFAMADPALKTRTLLIPVSYIGKMTEEELAAEYPYPFKVVTKEELSKAILEQTPNTCFVEHTNIPAPTVTVIDIPTGKALYQGTGEVPIYGFGRTLKILKDKVN